MHKFAILELKKRGLRKTKEDIKIKLNRIFKIDRHNNENETGLFKIRMQYGVPAYTNTLVKDTFGNGGVIIGSKKFDFGYSVKVHFIDGKIMFMDPGHLEYKGVLTFEHFRGKTLIEMFHEF